MCVCVCALDLLVIKFYQENPVVVRQGSLWTRIVWFSVGSEILSLGHILPCILLSSLFACKWLMDPSFLGPLSLNSCPPELLCSSFPLSLLPSFHFHSGVKHCLCAGSSHFFLSCLFLFSHSLIPKVAIVVCLCYYSTFPVGILLTFCLFSFSNLYSTL